VGGQVQGGQKTRNHFSQLLWKENLGRSRRRRDRENNNNNNSNKKKNDIQQAKLLRIVFFCFFSRFLGANFVKIVWLPTYA